ncbi:MAG: hypothetical protein ACRD0G_13880 [Acidimicrobiales bacterium]
MRRAVAAVVLCGSVVLGIGTVTLAHEGIATSEPKAGERVDRNVKANAPVTSWSRSPLVGGSTVAALVLTWWYRRTRRQQDDVL